MTFLLILGITTCLLTLAALIGARLPKTHAASSRIRLNVPVDEAWRSVTDFAEFPKWRPGLSRVDAGPEIDGRPTWYEYCRPGVKVQLQFAEFEPKKRLVTRLVGDKLPIYGAWAYEFADDNGGTLLTITESDKIYNPLLRFFSRIVFPDYAAMDVFLIALARHFGLDSTPEHLSQRVGSQG